MTQTLIPPNFGQERDRLSGKISLIWKEGDLLPTVASEQELEEYLYSGEYELVMGQDDLIQE